MKTDFFGKGLWSANATIRISFNSLGVNGNFMQIYETDERGTFFRINVKIFLVKCKNMLARFNK